MAWFLTKSLLFTENYFKFNHITMKKLFFLCLALVVTVLSSCFKEPKPAPVGDAYINAVNAVKGSTPQEFYLNGSKKNNAAIPYGASSGYITVTSGDAQFAFGNVGSDVANAATQPVGVPIGINATVFYYTQNKDANTQEELHMATIINDDMKPSLVAGKAKVRFINLNYLLNNTISVLSGTTKIIEKIPFKSASSYIDVDPGSKFKFVADIVDSPASAELDPNLQANKNYTIWIDGVTATELTGHVVAQ